MFSSIQHTGYLVRDLDEAVAWYEKTFQAKYTGGGPASGVGGRIGFLQMGNTEVELIEPQDKSVFAGSSNHVFHHVGYVVDDLDKVVADFRARGYGFATAEPMVNVAGYRLIFFDTHPPTGLEFTSPRPAP